MKQDAAAYADRPLRRRTVSESGLPPALQARGQASGYALNAADEQGFSDVACSLRTCSRPFALAVKLL